MSKSDLKKQTTLTSLPAIVGWPSSSETDTDKFHNAVVVGKTKRIKKLVARGVHPDARNEYGQTGLFVGAMLGNKSVVKTLLKLGANPNGRCHPQGHTAVHGACFIGSLGVLKTLLIAGGDLRLTDIKRQRPEEWIEYQGSMERRKSTRNFIERLRFCITKSDVKDIKKELNDKLNNLGVSWWSRFWSVFAWKCGRRKNLINDEERICDQILSVGFGKLYFGTGQKCVQAIGLPVLSEINDLKYDDNPKAPSWINGTFSTFIPMVWEKRNMAVISKILRTKSVKEAVPDVLIAELNILVRIQHPQILMVLAVCQEENSDSLSLVFEKVSLGSLYFFLHQQNLRMKSSFATDIIIQISEALDYVHGSGLLHCGISSHAVMLVAENQAKLACFEYAIPEEQVEGEHLISSRHPFLTSDSHLSVIRHWMAPEILAGFHSYSQASDVYSLCCVMWELVVGDLPWKEYELQSLRILMKESPGLQLQLRKDIIPPLWLSVLKVGLKPKREERDLDFKEMRYMMTLAKEGSSISSTGKSASVERKNLNSRTTSARSIKSANLFAGGDNNFSSKVYTTDSRTSCRAQQGIDVVDEDNNIDDEDQNERYSPKQKNSKTVSRTSLNKSFKSEAFMMV